MANQQLIDYIKKAREAGMSDIQIRERLLGSGWQEGEIEDAFAVVLGGVQQLQKLSFLEKVKGFLFNPSETFEAVRQESLGLAFRYYLILLSIFSALIAVGLVLFFSGVVSFITALLSLTGQFRMFTNIFVNMFVFGVLIFVMMLLGVILAIFIGGLWVHLWVYLLGGRGGIRQTLKAIMYASTPQLLLGWIPIVGFVVSIWGFVLSIIGIHRLHRISISKAILVYALVSLPFIIISLVLYL